jgi:hypothetical protein
MRAERTAFAGKLVKHTADYCVCMYQAAAYWLHNSRSHNVYQMYIGMFCTCGDSFKTLVADEMYLAYRMHWSSADIL